LLSWKEIGIENSHLLHRNPKDQEEVVLQKLLPNQMKMPNQINLERNQKLVDLKKAHLRNRWDHMIQALSLNAKRKVGSLNKTSRTSFKISFLKSKSTRSFNMLSELNTRNASVASTKTQ
jgi:hypothetical protein